MHTQTVFAVFHGVAAVQIKSDRSSCVKSEKRKLESERELQILLKQSPH